MQIFPHKLTAKTILIVLSAIIIVHVSIFFAYTQANRNLQQKANRDATIQKIINAIQIVIATQPNARNRALAAMDDPHMKASLSEKPKWELQFHVLSYWAISEELRAHYNNFRFSIYLAPKTWLNINASVDTSALIIQIFLILSEILVALGILVSAWSISRFTKPLKDFKHVADRLGIDVDTKISAEYGHPIVRETAHAMQKMQQRIRDLINDRTQMLAAISHDLRTPITRLKLRAQFVKNPEQYQKIIKDLDEMEAMISQILAFARDDVKFEERQDFDLCALLQSICDDMTDLVQDASFNAPEQSIIFHGQRLALKRAFTNLIENGIKYGKKVHVRISLSKKQITITIDDHGPGIPSKDLEKVFSPFYRAEPSRSRETGGVGLGLAVSQDIIRRHGGKIILSNLSPRGLRVTVTLPLKTEINTLQ